MIIGLFIRYYKTYNGIHYIPLSTGYNFNGLLGDNGVGKSSVFEALDTLFNNKQWNFNSSVKKSGVATTEPYIVPIFLLERTFFTESLFDKAQTLDQICRESCANSAMRANLKSYPDHLSRLSEDGHLEDKFLIPIGINYENKPFSNFLDANQAHEYADVLDYIVDKIDFIYVPKEIDTELFTKLESRQIETLMGETLTKKIQTIVPETSINQINQELNKHIKKIQNSLVDYDYRTSTDRQLNIRKTAIYNLIIQTFFSTRKLNKKHGSGWLEIGSLSSGEKQKALVDVAHRILTKHRSDANNLILAIDEPETSLHASACYDQFQKLLKISNAVGQVLFATHWYGFLPTISKGNATVITRIKDSHQFDLLSLHKYREEIKQVTKLTKGLQPYNMRLKGINDFIQTIVTTITSEKPQNWLICEGSSEAVYFNKYFSLLNADYKINIVPVGGISEVKRIYSHLKVACEDIKYQMKGKIYLLIDTDANLVQFSSEAHPNIVCKRIINSNGKTDLVGTDSSLASPVTTIEDALESTDFLATLRDFTEKHSERLAFLKTIVSVEPEIASGSCLDLKQSEIEQLKKFFTDVDKVTFAEAYCSKLNESSTIPEWIKSIFDYYTPKTPVIRPRNRTVQKTEMSHKPLK